MIAFGARRTQPKLNARGLGRKNLDFRNTAAKRNAHEHKI